MNDSVESTIADGRKETGPVHAEPSITRVVDCELKLLGARVDQLLAYQHVISGNIQHWEDHPLKHVHVIVSDFGEAIDGIVVRLRTLTREEAQGSGDALLVFIDEQFGRTAALVSRLAELSAQAMERAGDGGRNVSVGDGYPGDSSLLSQRILSSTFLARAYGATHSFVLSQIAAIASAAKCVDDAAFLSASLVMSDLRKGMDKES
jgi:hypothetical protein